MLKPLKEAVQVSLVVAILFGLVMLAFWDKVPAVANTIWFWWIVTSGMASIVLEEKS